MDTDENEPIERLVERARSDPDAVQIDPILEALDGADGNVQNRAVGALYEISKTAPERLAEAVPPLVDVLDSDRPTVKSKALLAMDKIGAVRAAALLPYADVLSDALDDDSVTVRRSAAQVLGKIAVEDPSAAESGVPALLEMLDSDSEPTRRRAMEALRPIAADESSAVEIPIEPLLDVLENRYETPSDLTYDPAMASPRASANDQMRGLRVLANDDSERSENTRVRESAAELLALLAATDPQSMAMKLEPHSDRVFAFLDDRNPTVRGSVVGVLAYVAEYDPASVRPAEERLVKLLEEPIAIGGNAVWALRYLESERSLEALEALADDQNADSELRSIARRALEDLDT